MKHSINYLVFGLNVFQVVFAILALTVGGFAFQSGSAGFGVLALVVLMAGTAYRGKDLYWLIGAFVFSIVGDYFLSNREGEVMRFVYGIFFFLLAHIGYLAYALYNGSLARRFTALLCTAYLIFFFTTLYDGIGDTVLLWAALAYLFVSCFSMGAAWGLKPTGRAKWLYILGIGLIVFSDTLIALREFVQYHTLDFLILPTYYLAHILVVVSVWERFRNQRG